MRTKTIVIAAVTAVGSMIALHGGDCPLKKLCQKNSAKTETSIVTKN